MAPKVVVEKEIGNGQMGTYMFAEVAADGSSSKVIKDSCIAQKSLAPPPGATEAVLLGGVEAKVLFSLDNTPHKDGDRVTNVVARMRTIFTTMTPGVYDSEKPTGATLGPKA